ncbi:Dabb family protein [Paraburkholderia sp. C35]|uniref:Dabb family protein n=1 Tax=Paraburkholderia sp. C35 TaxID=2126993 RepID=UPI000D687A9D|nr:Dabb family protein [Paraburkholderia sp. C35]
MIKHIVMWNVRGNTPSEKAHAVDRIKAAFEGLTGKIPGLLNLEVGADVSCIDYACDVVLYSEFDSAESLAQYAVHAEHLRVKAELGDLRVARHQVDYEAPL